MDKERREFLKISSLGVLGVVGAISPILSTPTAEAAEAPVMKMSLVNIKDYGAVGDGTTDDTEAIRSAINYANSQSPKMGIFIPKGTYVVTAYDHNTQFNNILKFTSGMVVVGEGYDSVIKFNPQSIKGDGSYLLFNTESNTILSNFRIDGNKANLNLSSVSNCACHGIYITEDSTNVTFEGIWVHDLGGVEYESFGLATRPGNSNVRFINCIGWNVNGTPFHVVGDWLNKLTKDVDVINCKGYNNTWQGVSVYGAEDVRIRGFVAYNNSQNGINVEWAKKVRVHDCVSHDNGYAGFGTHGYAEDLILHDCHFYNNNTSNQTYCGEIWLYKGQWWKDPKPRAVLKSIEIHNCRVAPGSLTNAKHLHYIYDARVSTPYSPIPEKILINCPDSEKWIIGAKKIIVDENLSTSTTVLLPSLKYKGLEIIRPVFIGNLRTNEWTLSYSCSRADYTDTDAKSPSAVRLKATSQYGNMYSKYVLLPNRLYRIRTRVKVESTSWILYLKSSGSQSIPYGITFDIFKGSEAFKDWVEAEYIFPTDQNSWRLQFQYDGTASGETLVVDYIGVEELISETSSY